jgi:hypothetical protein
MRTIKRLTAVAICVVAACQTPTDTDAPSRVDPSGLPHITRDVTPDAGGIKFLKPSLETTACVNATNQLEVTDTWINQTIDPTKNLTITLVLKGTHLGSNTLATTFIGPYLPSSFGTAVYNGFKSPDGDVPWSSFSTIAATASGAFSDVAPTLRQPKTGWPSC